MKKLLQYFLLTCVIATGYMGDACATGAELEYDDIDFDSFAITDSEDSDILVDEVALNMDADVANVGDFDLAGIMLGMSFDDVYTLFFKTKGLYAPRQNNSIIYTIHPDWKYNLD